RKPCGTVITHRAAPPDQRLFAEKQVRPGKNRKKVPAIRVIPGRAESSQHHSVCREKVVHYSQHWFGLAEMLKGIKRNDYVRLLVRIASKVAALVNPSQFGGFTCAR